MRNEAFANDGATPQPWDYDINGTWDQKRYTDWQKELIGGTAKTTNAQISMSGGNGNTQFLIGGGYYRETTVFPGDKSYQKGSAHFNLTHVSTDQRFRASFSSSYGTEKSNLFSVDLTQYINLPPNAPALYDEMGKINWENGTWINPLSALLKTFGAKSDNLIGNTVLSYEIIPGIQLKTNLGYTKITRDEIQTNPLYSYGPYAGVTSQEITSHFANNQIDTWIIEPQASWTKRIGEGQLNILVGSTVQQNISKGQRLQGTGFNSDALVEQLSAANSVSVTSSSYNQYRYTAFFGRINYDWKGKYLLNLTARRDGSSRFGPDKRFANFGAIGAAWIFSNEEFIQKNFGVLSFGKLRGSYGTTGNDQIGDYRYLELWGSTGNPYQGSSGLYPTRIGNPDYAWEMNKKIEAGLELGFIKDRIQISASYFRNTSTNQLVNYALPPSTGFSGIQDNLKATVQNSGYEFEFSTKNFSSGDFTWTTSANITIPKNKLVSFPDLEKSNYALDFEVGKPLSIQKRFHYTGVDPQSGLYSFEDYDRDGKSLKVFAEFDNPDDLQAIKKIAQDYYGGIQNSLSFKGFQLDFMFQFVKQTGRNYLTGFSSPGTMFNQPTVVLNRWQKEGDVTDIQRYSRGGTASLQYLFGARLLGDLNISDASFIRLKNISLSYSLPSNCTSKLRMQQAKVFIQGQNVLTFTNYLGMDPETQNIISLPPLRTIIVGAQFSF